MARVGRRGRGEVLGEGQGNTNDLDPSLTCGVIWSSTLIKILWSMYKKKKNVGQNYNPIAKHQWKIMLHVFNKRANVYFTRDFLISKTDSPKWLWKAEKKKKKKHNCWHSINMDLVWSMWSNLESNTQNSMNWRCDWCWRCKRRCWSIWSWRA